MAYFPPTQSRIAFWRSSGPKKETDREQPWAEGQQVTLPDPKAL